MDAHTLKVLEYDELKEILASYCRSELSRGVVAGLLPSSDPARLALSLEQLDEARHLSDLGRPIPIGGLADMLGVVRLGHRQGRALEPAELLSVRRVLASCRRLSAFFDRAREEAPRLAALSGKLLDHDALVEDIERVVEAPGAVRDDASERLWELRRRKHSLEERIRDQMQALVHGARYRPYLRDRSYSVRNGRFVLPVILDKKGHVPGILHDKSASGNTAFIEPQEVAVLSNELQDVRLDEQRETSQLLLELSRRVYEEEERLAYTQNVAAWLDFTAARAEMSAALGLVSAELSETPCLTLRDARHPLLLCARARGELDHEVVPASLELGRDHHMLVITGPNTGGKTVALKTVGLIQLMFQSGLHVPAAPGTALPCLDGVYADIGDEQSLTQNLSTFSGHVRNIAEVLRRAGPRSLLLLDELGAGTDPEEGAALGQAILERLSGVGALTVVTTHLGSLKTFGFTRSGVENACVTFDPETLEPEFRLLVGQPGSSNALIIARRYGIPQDVVTRGEALMSSAHRGTEELMVQLAASRRAAEVRRQQSEDLVQQSRSKLDAAERELGEAREARKKAEQEAESEVERLVAEHAAAARPHLNALKNVPRALKPHVEELERLARERLHVGSFAKRRREFVRRLKKHDQVWVPRFTRVCRVEKLNRAEERLVVRVGEISMEIGFDDVSWVTPPAE